MTGLDFSTLKPVDAPPPALDFSRLKPLDFSALKPVDEPDAPSLLEEDEVAPGPSTMAGFEPPAEPPAAAPSPPVADTPPEAAPEGTRSAEVEAMAGRVGAAPQTPDDALRRLFPAVERGARRFRQGMSVLWAEIAAQPGPTATVQAQLDAYDAIDRGEPAGVDPGTVVGNRARMYQTASPEARQRLRERAQAQLRGFAEAGGRAAEGAGETIAEQETRIREIPPPESVVRFNESKTFGEAWSRFLEAPAEITATLIGESAAPSMVSMLGSVAGLVVGGVPGMIAGGGAGSFASEYGSKFLEAFQEAGVDISRPGAVATALSNPEMMAEIRQKAALKGLGVAAFDALSIGLAGKLVRGATGVRSFVGRGAGELAMQSAAGAAGEAAGSVLAGEEINPAAVLAEAIAEIPGGVGETAMGAYARRNQPAPAKPEPRLDYSGFVPVGPSGTPESEPAAGKGEGEPGPDVSSAPGNASPPAPRSIEEIEEDLSLFRSALEEEGVSDTEKTILERAIAETEAERTEARGDGTRSNPVVVESAEDMERAKEQLDSERSDGKSLAGNHSMAHVDWNDLRITVQVAKGEDRIGTAPDGSTWRAPAPADYGHIKGTVGKDGEPVDIYMGPDPSQKTVYVVNQVDPETGKLDEHKILAAFPSEEEAVAAYDAAFSDGSGPERRGSVASLSVDDLKKWLKKKGATKQFLHTDLDDAPLGPKPGRSIDILEFIANRGGIVDDGGELKAMDLHTYRRPGMKRLVRAAPATQDPLHPSMARGRYDFYPDGVREAAIGAGYLPEDATIDDLYEAMRSTRAGQPVFSQNDANDVAAREEWEQAQADRDRARTKLQQDAILLKVDPEQPTKRLKAAIREREIEIKAAEAAAQRAVASIREEMGDAEGLDYEIPFTDVADPRPEAASAESQDVGEAVPGLPDEVDDGDRAEREALPEDGDEGVKPKETFRQQVDRMKGERKRYAAELKAALDKNGMVLYQRPNGGTVLITKSVDSNYAWRLTFFEANKEPSGHQEFKDLDDLAREARGWSIENDKAVAAKAEKGAVDQTDQGPQNVIPGAEKKTAAEVKDAKTEAAAAKKAEEKRVEGAQSKLRRGNQKSVADQDGGMFSAERDQKTMLMVQPPYYSALEEALPKLPAKGTGPQMLATLKNTQGVKEGEIVAIGLDQWLPKQDKVTRQEIQEFVRQNKVEITEVRHGKTMDEIPPDAKAIKDNQEEWDRLVALKNHAMEMADSGIDVMPEGYAHSGSRVVGPDGQTVGAVTDPDDVAYVAWNHVATQAIRGLDELNHKMVDETAKRQGLSGKPAKFSSYTLPGGENYREVLLTLPVKTDTSGWKAVRTSGGVWAIRDADGRFLTNSMAATESEAIADAARQSGQAQGNTFSGGHFDEPNVLAHIRLNDRTDADGKRVLFVEEIQSDWMQLHRRQTAAIEKAVASDFDGIVAQMKRDGVLTEVCD